MLRHVLVLFALTALACSGGGAYVETDRIDDDERGDTNGRSFDFVSTKPEGDEWTLRLRGRALWVAYSTAEKTEELGTLNLTAKEVEKLWDAIDVVDLPSRKRGMIDRNEGTLLLRLRDPGEGRHDMFTVYVSRSTEDEDVIDLAERLQKVIEKYKNEKPSF